MFALAEFILKANPLFGVGLLIRSPQLYFLNPSHPMPKHGF
ncbi:hypothetical protein HPHPA9_0739 [Helicobacter pylori Hp A-9]|uniref:Uncharacterized protein n=1 Tax=Helicobacter pylori Hp A-9 TaxID=992034 RepID=I9REF7_HELPX|nr:hypothetical protein HPHPA9_0739 [Helicobacter pylori Hp A-9]